MIITGSIDASVMLPPYGRSISFIMLKMVARAIIRPLSVIFCARLTFFIVSTFLKKIVPHGKMRDKKGLCNFLRRHYPYQVKGSGKNYSQSQPNFIGTPVVCILDTITKSDLCQVLFESVKIILAAELIIITV